MSTEYVGRSSKMVVTSIRNLVNESKTKKLWLARVASVSVGLGSKESLRNGISVFCPREKWCESQKEERGGGGGEGRKRLQTNPWILKTTYLTFHA